jgi:hypothetical protein
MPPKSNYLRKIPPVSNRAGGGAILSGSLVLNYKLEIF